MNSLDEVFLAIEDANNPMNIGSVVVFPGPIPPVNELREDLARRVSLTPRCLQRVRMPRGPLGRPVWVDTTAFDPREHVLHAAIPPDAPHTLDETVARLSATRLDRSRPLWRLWIVDDSAHDRWALIAVVHHCMVDGIAGSDLLNSVLSDTRGGEPPRTSMRAPGREPSATEVLLFGVRSGVRSGFAHLHGVFDVVAHPLRSWATSRRVLAAARRLWLQPHHRNTSLVGEIGPHRTWASTAIPLERVQAIRVALGGTVNDIVLAAITCALRDLLLRRGESVDGRTVTAMVPVSARTPDDVGSTGNRLANVHAPLPVGTGDPREVVRQVRILLEDLKSSHETEATSLLMHIGDHLPRIVADRIARTVFQRQRDIQIVVTNVPGPQGSFRIGDHRASGGFPVAPIGGRIRITIAVWSNCGTLAFGITGDGDTAPDVDDLARLIAHRFDDLLTAAREAEDHGNRRG